MGETAIEISVQASNGLEKSDPAAWGVDIDLSIPPTDEASSRAKALILDTLDELLGVQQQARRDRRG